MSQDLKREREMAQQSAGTRYWSYYRQIYRSIGDVVERYAFRAEEWRPTQFATRGDLERFAHELPGMPK